MRRLDCRTGLPIFGEGDSQTAGLWTIAAPSPAALTAYLLTLVIQMDVREQSKSLIHELTAVLNDINNDTLGLACSDLATFSDHVTAQTGKKITAAQAAQMQTWVSVPVSHASDGIRIALFLGRSSRMSGRPAERKRTSTSQPAHLSAPPPAT